MALQNTRALLFRGEDTSYGGASAKEVIFTTTAVAAARPVLLSLGFVGSTNQLSALLGVNANVNAAMGGLNRVLINRSPSFWMTLTCALAQGNSSQANLTVAIPVAPRQAVFLPHTAYNLNPSPVVADSSWPLVVAPGAAAGYVPPIAGTSSMINFDWLAEQ